LIDIGTFSVCNVINEVMILVTSGEKIISDRQVEGKIERIMDGGD
jgi:hypothetical protein